jgi:hypothetical protein
MMADTALDTQADSSKPKRACKWCSKDISHRGGKAKWCEDRSCYTSAYYAANRQSIRGIQNQRKRKAGGYDPLDGRFCAICSVRFNATHARQVNCTPECRSKGTRDRNIEHYRAKALSYQKENRFLITENERVRRRQRSASASLSAILLPLDDGLKLCAECGACITSKPTKTKYCSKSCASVFLYHLKNPNSLRYSKKDMKP